MNRQVGEIASLVCGCGRKYAGLDADPQLPKALVNGDLALFVIEACECGGWEYRSACDSTAPCCCSDDDLIRNNFAALEMYAHSQGESNPGLFEHAVRQVLYAMDRMSAEGMRLLPCGFPALMVTIAAILHSKIPQVACRLGLVLFLNREVVQLLGIFTICAPLCHGTDRHHFV